jgi:hypothetical protein
MFRSYDHLQGATLFLAKVTFLKMHSLINFLILTWCCGSMSYCASRRTLSAPGAIQFTPSYRITSRSLSVLFFPPTSASGDSCHSIPVTKVQLFFSCYTTVPAHPPDFAHCKNSVGSHRFTVITMLKF